MTNDFLFSPGQQTDGFTVTRVETVPEFRCIAYELEHRGSGARILHLHNEDSENLFSITFPTPPPDDTGVPHIIEHSVLGGSRKYSVKDPFFEMIKCSMATFINAMTGSDYTVYPVASNVKRDFYNLADVYWDAVFHPTLSYTTFQREAHHLEFERKGDLGSDLRIKGIVYNEMKGARSGPESIVLDLIEKRLWPDGKDSGGDPERIPDLTFEQFKKFHKTHYHPSCAYFFLYGDIPTSEHLKFIGPRLNEFTRRDAGAPISLQPAWKTPRVQTESYAAGPTDPVENKTYININWLVGDGVHLPDVLNWSALDLILLGHQAAPLRKALIDSHLGEDVLPAGLWVNGRQSSFHVGLKGTEAARREEFEKLVFATLKKVADEGVDRGAAEAAFQQLAYRNLEIASLFPLHLMSRAIHLWMHGADPLAALRTKHELEALKKRYDADPRMFSKLIEEKLLNNTHRLTMTVGPDRELQAKKDAELTEKLRALKASLSTSELEKIAADQETLEALLSAPNSPEAIAALPQLHVSDLPPVPKNIPTTVHKLPSLTLLRNDVFANGVNYLHVSFDLSNLPEPLWPYLPMYAQCVGKMGALGMDYTHIAKRIAAHTGGISFSHAALARSDGPGDLRRGTFSTKFLDEKAEAALEIFGGLILKLDCTDAPRLTDVLSQIRSHHRTRPATEGLSLALRRAESRMNRSAFLNELWHGVPQTRLIERLAAAANRDELIEKLTEIGKYFHRAGKPTASFTGSDTAWEYVQRYLGKWMEKISPQGGPTALSFEREPGRSEGLAAPMNVAYCAMVLPAPRVYDPVAPLLAVGARLVSYNHILEEVRFKGTAYGGGCSYSANSGALEFYSYRDPWIWRTLDAYRSSLDYVNKAEWPQAEVERAIIGTAKEFERPIRPGDATGSALWRYLTGDTDDLRKKRHAAMLQATPATVRRAVLDVFEAGFPQASVCVVSSRQKLDEANQQRPNEPLVVEEILGQ
jgi:Zn-dependent M16 (insulinase) family peptidase